MGSDQDDQKTEKMESVAAQLKCPLAFFGLALTVLEGTFGTALITRSYSQLITAIIALSMAFLFLVSILVVAFLVYKVPTHLMLLAQHYVEAASKRLIELDSKRNRILRAAQIVDKISENLPVGSEELETSLRELRIIMHETFESLALI